VGGEGEKKVKGRTKCYGGEIRGGLGAAAKSRRIRTGKKRSDGGDDQLKTLQGRRNKPEMERERKHLGWES